jgi:hypothetical protein
MLNQTLLNDQWFQICANAIDVLKMIEIGKSKCLDDKFLVLSFVYLHNIMHKQVIQ